MTDGARGPVRRLTGVGELLRLGGDDPYVRAEVDRDRVTRAWATDAATDVADGPDARGAVTSLAWLTSSRHVPGRIHAVVLGPAPAAADLLGAVLAEVDGETGGEIGSVTLTRGAAELLTTYALDRPNDWEWLSTATAPPGQRGEAQVRWLGERDHDRISALLERASPRHDAKPGGPGVLRWCGVREDAAGLVAVAAHTEHRNGVPFLASVATAPELRGAGLGSAVTAWLTRRLLEEGHDLVTLGMYSDNDVARRVYLRLGFRVAHEFTSGRLVRR